MKNNDAVEYILNCLKQKSLLSDLEKDILSACNKYLEVPFDRKGRELKIIENNMRYPEIFAAISALPRIENKPFYQLSDEEIQQNLFLQIQAMWVKRAGCL